VSFERGDHVVPLLFAAVLFAVLDVKSTKLTD
jgi:hypothetical protein